MQFRIPFVFLVVLCLSSVAVADSLQVVAEGSRSDFSLDSPGMDDFSDLLEGVDTGVLDPIMLEGGQVACYESHIDLQFPFEWTAWVCYWDFYIKEKGFFGRTAHFTGSGAYSHETPEGKLEANTETMKTNVKKRQQQGRELPAWIRAKASCYPVRAYFDPVSGCEVWEEPDWDNPTDVDSGKVPVQ